MNATEFLEQQAAVIRPVPFSYYTTLKDDRPLILLMVAREVTTASYEPDLAKEFVYDIVNGKDSRAHGEEESWRYFEDVVLPTMLSEAKYDNGDPIIESKSTDLGLDNFRKKNKEAFFALDHFKPDAGLAKKHPVMVIIFSLIFTGSEYRSIEELFDEDTKRFVDRPEKVSLAMKSYFVTGLEGYDEKGFPLYTRINVEDWIKDNLPKPL